MKRIFRESGFAFSAWVIPFLASVVLYPLKRAVPPLFDAVMGVVMVLSTSLLAYWYLRKSYSRPLSRGVWIAVLWTLSNWCFDAMMFSRGPMKMSFIQYTVGIGVAYLMIPVITITIGAAVRAGIVQGTSA